MDKLTESLSPYNCIYVELLESSELSEILSSSKSELPVVDIAITKDDKKELEQASKVLVTTLS